ALWGKRDDATGLAGGGNKARKLGYLCADALDQGCDTLVTGGGRQSNHVRMTAAAANRLGLACTIVLSSGPPTVPTGNVVLDYLLGPDIVWAGDLDYYGVEAAIDEACAKLQAAGRPLPNGRVRIDHDRFGDGYGAPTDSCLEALRLAARLEGLVLDPVYTGKGMAGLVAAVRDGRIKRDQRTVFLHTGGMPALFV